MQRIKSLALLLALVIMIAGCATSTEQPIAATPEPEATVSPDNVDPASTEGTLGALAAIMTETLGIPVSAGSRSGDPAVGSGAARLAVEALGLSSSKTLESMGATNENTDWLAIALENDLAPISLFTYEPMTAQQMQEFADAVAKRMEEGVGQAAQVWEGAPSALNDDLAALCEIATIAYNPLAANRGAFYYSEGDIEKLSFWTLMAFGTALTENTLSDGMKEKLSFVAINDQTDPSKGSTTADEALFRECIRQLWGIEMPQQVPGLTMSGGRVYLGHPTGDLIRQYAYPYRAEQQDDQVRVYADVLNASVPAQYAGKGYVTLRENPDAMLGYQIASISRAEEEASPAFASVDSQITADGYDAKALIDGNHATAWQMAGNVKDEDAQITLSFNQPTDFSGMAFFNGNHSGAQAALDRDGSAGRIGIRLDGGESDILRFDISGSVEALAHGYEVVIPFSKTLTATSVTIVFYGDHAKRPISISDIRAL